MLELESKKFRKAFETIFSCNILQPLRAYPVVLKTLQEKKKYFGLVLVFMKMKKIAKPLAHVYPQRNEASSWYLSSCFWHFH